MTWRKDKDVGKEGESEGLLAVVSPVPIFSVRRYIQERLSYPLIDVEMREKRVLLVVCCGFTRFILPCPWFVGSYQIIDLRCIFLCGIIATEPSRGQTIFLCGIIRIIDLSQPFSSRSTEFSDSSLGSM